jgi:hypothetical protein
MAIKMTKGNKSITISRPVGRGLRAGPRDGSGPRGGTAACPYTASEQVSAACKGK